MSFGVPKGVPRHKLGLEVGPDTPTMEAIMDFLDEPVPEERAELFEFQDAIARMQHAARLRERADTNLSLDEKMLFWSIRLALQWRLKKTEDRLHEGS